MKIDQAIIYKCDICGKKSHWIYGKWIAHDFLVVDFEHEFHVCSVDCDDRLLAIGKNGRRHLARQILMNRINSTYLH